MIALLSIIIVKILNAIFALNEVEITNSDERGPVPP